MGGQKPQDRRDPRRGRSRPRKKRVCDPGYIAPAGESLCCERWMKDEQPDWWDWRWAGYLPACWFLARMSMASSRWEASLNQATALSITATSPTSVSRCALAYASDTSMAENGRSGA